MRYLRLCSGIETASLAWQALGWTPVAFAETDPFCGELLAQRFPDLSNLSDVNNITKDSLKPLGYIDMFA